MWSIKTDLMTPFPDALHPTDKQDDGGKYPLAFQQESHRHWHQDVSRHPHTRLVFVSDHLSHSRLYFTLPPQQLELM